MKAAVVLVGRITSWKQNLQKTIDIINKNFSDCEIDYYASIHGDVNDPEPNDFINFLKPVKYNIEKYIKEGPEFLSTDTHEEHKEKMRILRTLKFESWLYHKHKCLNMIMETNIHYDWIIYARHDWAHVWFERKVEYPSKNTLYVFECHITFNKNWYNDHFICGDSVSMTKYLEMHLYKPFRDTSNECNIYEYINDICNLKVEGWPENHALDDSRGGHNTTSINT